MKCSSGTCKREARSGRKTCAACAESIRKYNGEHPEQAAAYRKKNKTKRAAYTKKWILEHPEQHRRSWRNSHLKRQYGITIEQYDSMLAAQGGHCAICPAVKSRRGYGYLCVDHDHKTGKVRGLLCNDCNLMLGKSGDSAKRLLAAAHYLGVSRV